MHKFDEGAEISKRYYNPEDIKLVRGVWAIDQEAKKKYESGD